MVDGCGGGSGLARSYVSGWVVVVPVRWTLRSGGRRYRLWRAPCSPLVDCPGPRREVPWLRQRQVSACPSVRLRFPRPSISCATTLLPCPALSSLSSRPTAFWRSARRNLQGCALQPLQSCLPLLPVLQAHTNIRTYCRIAAVTRKCIISNIVDSSTNTVCKRIDCNPR